MHMEYTLLLENLLDCFVDIFKFLHNTNCYRDKHALEQWQKETEVMKLQKNSEYKPESKSVTIYQDLNNVFKKYNVKRIIYRTF